MPGPNARDVKKTSSGLRRRSRASSWSCDVLRRDFLGPRRGLQTAPSTLDRVGSWYWIGVSRGPRAWLGVLCRGALRAASRLGARRLAVVVGRRASARCSATGPRRSPAASAGCSAAVGAALVVRGALRARRRRARRRRCSSALAALVLAALAFVPVVGYLEAVALPVLGAARCAAAAASATPACASSPRLMPTKKLILVVIDGLTPSMFEDAVERRSAPALAFLAEHGTYRRGRLDVPVADAGLPLARSRPARTRRARDPAPRLVPPRRAAASSSTARRSPPSAPPATRRSILDTIFNMNARAPRRSDAVDDVRGARGRRPRRPPRSTSRATAAARAHRPRVPGVDPPALRAEAVLLLQPLRVGPDRRAARGARPRAAARSTRTRPRSAAGSSRATASTCSSTTSPTTTSPRTRTGRTARTRRSRAATTAVGALVDGGRRADEFLERYAVVVCSDHGQTHVDRAGRGSQAALRRRRRRCVVDRLEPRRDGLPAARVPRRRRELAARLDGDDGGRGRALPRGRRGGRAPRRRGAALPPTSDGWRRPATRRCSTTRTGSSASGRRCANPNAGEVLVSAAPRAGSSPTSRGRHHAGGGSHGSLVAGDSEVPMLTVGARRASRARSSTSRRPRSRTSASSAPPYARRSRVPPDAGRAAWSSGSCAAATSRDERVLAAMDARAARAVRPGAAARPRLRGRGAADRRAARRSRSRTWSRASARRSRCAAASACSTSARARATRRRCSPSSRARCVTIERVPELAEQARASLAAAGYERVARARRRRHARRPGARAVRRDRRRRRRAARCPRRSTSSSRTGGRLVVPVGGRARPAARARSCAAPRARRSSARVPCRFVPLARRGGVRADA